MTTEAQQEVKEASAEVSNGGTEGAIVSKMRDSDIKWREKYKLTKSELEGLRAQAEKETHSLRTTIENAHKEKSTMEQKLIDAKLEAVAIAAGITDADLIKLIDKSNLKLTEDGELIGLKEAVNAFKVSKPHFFGAEKKTSSSTNAPIPQSEPPVNIRAMDMSKEQYEREIRKMLGHRFR